MNDTRLIPLTQGKFAIVDAADFEWLNQWKWHTKRSRRSKDYAVRGVYDGTKKIIKIRMHREILNAPSHLEVDHINGDTLDNRRANLRLATLQQNQWNRGAYKGNTSGFKGVYWYPKTSKWTPKIRVNGRLIHLGYFDDKAEAVRVYADAAKKYHGEYAHV